jgi:hypothetical protein
VRKVFWINSKSRTSLTGSSSTLFESLQWNVVRIPSAVSPEGNFIQMSFTAYISKFSNAVTLHNAPDIDISLEHTASIFRVEIFRERNLTIFSHFHFRPVRENSS